MRRRIASHVLVRPTENKRTHIRVDVSRRERRVDAGRAALAVNALYEAIDDVNRIGGRLREFTQMRATVCRLGGAKLLQRGREFVERNFCIRWICLDPRISKRQHCDDPLLALWIWICQIH